jgi:hypothetical protein
MINPFQKRSILSVVAMLIGVPAASANPMLNVTGGQLSATRGPATYGWAFDVLWPSGIAVTHLSLYDFLQNGLAEPHEIGIWDSNQVLRAMGVVPAGPSTPFDATGKFRTVAIPPVYLAPGTGYTIGAFYPREDTGDFALYRAMGLQVDPMIQYAGGRAAFESDLAYPAVSMDRVVPAVNPAFIGPSFQAIPVPEPRAVFLLAMGALAGAVGFIGRSRRPGTAR